MRRPRPGAATLVRLAKDFGYTGRVAPAPTRSSLNPAQLASSLRITIARLGRRIRQESTNAGDDLTPSRIAALTTIESLGPITLGELASVEQVQPPSMTRIVATLEERGLVGREVDAKDRRVARVAITDEGRRLLAQNRERRTAFL